jgi:predicted HTH transcriptional regulator
MEENDVFKLIVRYEKEGITSEKKKVVEKIKHAEKILELIAENPKVTAVEMAVELSLSERQIRVTLAQLVSEKIISRTGSRKIGEWRLSKS